MSIEPMELYGRRKIYTSAEKITKDNVIEELNSALSIHYQNVYEIEYLYNYRRGNQPILSRQKRIRPEINNKIVENHADEIVSFKDGYFLTQPAKYISRKKEKTIAKNVEKLNEFLYLSGKHEADNEIVDWFHTVGTGVLHVRPNNSDEIPVETFSLDPRNAFVVYSRAVGNCPMMGVNIVINEKNELIFDVFTLKECFRISGGTAVVQKSESNSAYSGNAVSISKTEKNYLEEIPIIEYHYNSCNMGAFENVIPLLDAINLTMSNRLDGIEQFIQSLIVAWNCQFEQGTTVNTIKENGMVLLKSTNENKADLKILAEQLNQTETQVVIDYMYQQILTICGMPSTTKGGTSTSDTGTAVLYRDGWYQADTFARNTTDLFKRSNRKFDIIFLKILSKKKLLDLSISDFELQFVRNETANLLVKTQGALNMKELGFSPEIAFARSGISNDPVSDVANSAKYIKAKWESFEKSDKEKRPQGKGEEIA